MAAPKLRFKEFDGDWCFRKIGDISECIVPGRNKPKLFDGDIPWVTTPDLKDKTYVSDTRSNYYISEEEAKSVGSKIVPTNSVIMSCVGDLGLFAINTKPIVINQQLHAFILDDHKYSSIFVLNALSKNQDYIERVATKTALPYLNKDNCNSIPLFLCSFKEQTKIASFLSNVDEKISQLTQKHALLSQYKQGMMQKLFSQQLRFKADDGSEFGEWEEKCLSELFEYANGKSFEAEVVENGKFKLITLNSIDIKANLKKVHKTISNSDNSLIKNDLIMILSDVAHGNFLGLTAIIPDNSYVLNQRVGRLRSRSEINIVFIRFYINFNQKYFKLNGQGSSQLNLSKADILNFPVSLPCLEEQTKIANFLSSIDQKIEVVAQQIEQAKTWKKGLLQQMFV